MHASMYKMYIMSVEVLHMRDTRYTSLTWLKSWMCNMAGFQFSLTESSTKVKAFMHF
jgi:hypothetical protein